MIRTMYGSPLIRCQTALVDARRLDGDEHPVVGDRRLLDLPQREHLGPAVGVLDDRLHRPGKLSQAEPTPRSG
jgi:hypothetical protein